MNFRKMIFVLLLPVQMGFALCEFCDWSVYEGPIYSYAYDTINQCKSKYFLDSPYVHWHSNWVRSYLKGCDDFSLYRAQFLRLLDFAEYSYQTSHNNIQSRILSLKAPSKDPEDRFSSHRYQEEIERLEGALISNQQQAASVQDLLTQGLSHINAECEKLYTTCIEEHGDQESLFQRSLVYYDQGKTVECVEDISKFIESGQPLPILENEDIAQFYLVQGEQYADLALYQQAISALTKAIEIDPDHKDAYFERAAAYFELGDLNQALSDFLESGFHSTPVRSDSFLEMAKGFLLGSGKGAAEAAKEFVPTLFLSIRGLSGALWSLAVSPEQCSVEFFRACKHCLKFLKTHSTPEIIQAISPELKTLVFDQDTLESYQKGELLGHMISKNGVEFFASAGCVKAFRELRKANTIMTLETLASSKSSSKLLEEVTKHEAKRLEVIRKFKTDEGFVKNLRGKDLPEIAVRRTLHDLGYKTFPRPKSMPTNFKAEFSQKKCGMVFRDPKNPSHKVRILPGNSASPYPGQQKPYVKHEIDGKAFDKSGNIVDKKSFEAHIPLKKFIYRNPRIKK